MKRNVVLRDPKRKVLLGFPVREVINAYSPQNPPIGRRPFGTTSPQHIANVQLRFRQKLPNDELNPHYKKNWRRYETVPKENRNNPDSFYYEEFKHGAKAFQQVYIEDMQRLVEYPEPSTLVVDVRSDMNLIKQHIPFSIRIPMEEVGLALQLEPEAFLQMYGIEKPEPGLDIICVSHDGVSSEKALKEFERWGHCAEQLYNFREGTNLLHNENYSDWGDAVEEVGEEDNQNLKYPLPRPDWLSQVGPLHPKYSPYPSEDLEEQLERDESRKWTIPVRGSEVYGKYVMKTADYKHLIDGQWLRARFVPDVKWYDFSHREPFSRWRDVDLSIDKAHRPLGARLNQLWKDDAH
eukprot:TRINITY_DN13488_c0_g1_i2.p1 TRINITY_DN13488_c0_g1~~TRINITY_DN13488_c0_g1_i2.p1  ORF type:complete len:351 (+),score=54.76 TRINITY_DN13488_c0_g1_i2:60-1112(+)